MRFLFLLIFLLPSCSPFLPTIGQRRPINEFGMTPQKTYPLDLLVAKHFQNKEIPDFRMEIVNSCRYGNGSFLKPSLVNFFSDKKREKEEEVETDFLPITEKSLYIHNHIPEIRPYLYNFPLTLLDMRILLYYGSNMRNCEYAPFYGLAILSGCGGELEFYRQANRSAPSVWFESLGERKKFSQIPGFEKLMNIAVLREKHRVTPMFIDQEIKRMNQGHFRKYHYPVLAQLEKKFHLHLTALRNTAIAEKMSREIASGFWVQNKKMSLDETKKFTESFIEEYLTLLKKKRVIEKTFRRDDEVFEKIKKNLDWFCFRITFWDEYLNRVEEPYIAQIQCEDSKIHYFAADEGQRLYKVLEEPIPPRFFPKGEDK